MMRGTSRTSNTATTASVRKKSLKSLSCDELCGLLSTTTIVNAVAKLQKAEVSGRQFSQCSEEDLINLGLTKLQLRDAMMMRRLWKRDGASLRGLDSSAAATALVHQPKPSGDFEVERGTNIVNAVAAAAEQEEPPASSAVLTCPVYAWDAEVDCDGQTAGMRAKWLVDQRCMSLSAAKERVMTVEYPQCFTSNTRGLEHGATGANASFSLLASSAPPKSRAATLAAATWKKERPQKSGSTLMGGAGAGFLGIISPSVGVLHPHQRRPAPYGGAKSVISSISAENEDPTI